MPRFPELREGFRPHTYQPRATHPDAQHNTRQPFHQPHTSISSAAHWLKTAGILSPLLIHEFVKDPEQRWRYTRIAVIATAALAQGLFVHRIHRERQERQGHRER